MWSQGHFYLQGGEGKPAALQEGKRWGRLACCAICAPRKDGALYERGHKGVFTYSGSPSPLEASRSAPCRQPTD